MKVQSVLQRISIQRSTMTPCKVSVRDRLVVCSQLKPAIMINSCLGKMGKAVAESVLRAGLELVPYTLCETSLVNMSAVSVAGRTIELVPFNVADGVITQLKKDYPNFITVDYTLPDAVNTMASFYVKHQTPFVMGTTGGNRELLLKTVQDASLYCVIAPNMGKQIVAFQAMMDIMATNFPDAFAGYTLRVTESHQSSKKDTSGTAKAVVTSFQNLGLDFDVSQISLVREPAEQVLRMKVPYDALSGHAYHTYQLMSPDGSVTFEFQHNVVGRTTYAEGTVDACLFLAKQIVDKSEKRCFSMIDVLKGGTMR